MDNEIKPYKCSPAQRLLLHSGDSYPFSQGEVKASQIYVCGTNAQPRFALTYLDVVLGLPCLAPFFNTPNIEMCATSIVGTVALSLTVK